MSRIRANQITNQSADGAPTVQNGLIISGVTTVTTLDLNGDLDVDGHTNLDNLSIAGVTTISRTGGNGQFNVERVSGAGLHIQAQTALGVFGTTSNHNLRLISNGNERMLLSTNGNITATNGNIIIGTAEKGIDFSAQTAGGGSVVSEVMNHFSTGTIGLTLKAGSNTVPLYNNTARYTRIGNICFISAWIRVNGSTVGSSYSSSDTLKLTGLPFAGSGNNDGRTRLRFNGYAFSGVSNKTWGWMVVADGPTTTLQELHWGHPDFSTITAPNGTNIHNSSSEIYINGHYFV